MNTRLPWGPIDYLLHNWYVGDRVRITRLVSGGNNPYRIVNLDRQDGRVYFGNPNGAPIH